MRARYRLVVFVLLAFMFRTPLLRLQQTAIHFSRIIPEAIQKNGHLSATTLANMSRPNGLTANKGLELLSFGTPNGHKVHIILEELKAAYGKPEYVYQNINIMENIQKEPWFTEKGPNGRIPVLVDHDKDGLGIMEGSAILSYLVRNFDPDHKFSFTTDPELSQVEQWMAWQHGGLGPMQGQANHFYRLTKERIPYPTQRYVGETERLYGILDAALAHSDYLVGNQYTIADVANFSWVNWSYFSGVQLDRFPHLHQWWQRIHARPAVQKGCRIPSESPNTNAGYQKRIQEDPGFAAKEQELADLAKKAKEQYHWKYSSP